jgi:hypothetical protein
MIPSGFWDTAVRVLNVGRRLKTPSLFQHLGRICFDHFDPDDEKDKVLREVGHQIQEFG